MLPLTEFICTECGNVTGKWAGQCPDCGEWNSLEERARSGKTGQGGKSIAKGGATSASAPARVKKLSEHKPSDFPRFSTNIDELDRVLGGGVVPGSAVVLSGEPGSGKALDLDTPLPTPEGWTTMGEVKIGDYLFDEQGQPCPVLAVSEIMHNREVYKVHFSDGSSILADGNHLWVIWEYSTCKAYDRIRQIDSPSFPKEWSTWGMSLESSHLWSQDERQAIASMRQDGMTCLKIGMKLGRSVNAIQQQWNRPPLMFGKENINRVKTTKQIAQNLHLHGVNNYCIPLAKSLNHAEKTLPIDPWVMGYLLGDGDTARAGRVACDPQDRAWLIKEFRKAGYDAVAYSDDGHFGVRKLSTLWREAGIVGKKHIPSMYLHASQAQRIQIVQGLIDSDGHVDNHGSYRFTNTNRSLIDGFFELIVSLGLKAQIYSRQGRIRNGVESAKSYEVAVPADRALARLPRKLNKARHNWKREQSCRYIVNVKKVSSRPVRCLQIASASKLFLAGEAMIPTHNSTLSSMVVDQLAGSGKRVAYIAGEESGEQIRLRTDRLGLTHSAGIDLSNEIEIGAVCSLLASGYDFAVVDSIQTLYDSELSGAPGSVSIVKQVGQALVRTAKESGVAIFLIGHVTKEGNLAGPRHLEHMVDVVLGIEGERVQAYRVLRAQKNRFGSTNEIGVFEMTGKGMLEVSDPTTIFLQDHDQQLSGSVICPTVEGTRPMLVEVQALAQPVAFANAPPLRRARGIDKNRLDMLIAVLQRHGRATLKLGAKDIYVNVSGGLRIEEPAFDLAVCIAIASAASGRPVRKGTSVFGEVSLLGEVRPVSQADRRLVEATKLGWPRVVAGGAQGNESVRYLSQAIHAALEKESGQSEEEE